MLFSADPFVVIYCRGRKTRMHPSTTQAPECGDSGGIHLRVELEPSGSNSCSHGEQFYKGLEDVTSSTCPQAPIGTSWILAVLDNPSHKEQRIHGQYSLSSFICPSHGPTAVLHHCEKERSHKSDHRHQGSGWMRTDIE